ncbi:MAG: ABC transporter substrate-binding protein [Dehalococcoidia bacterium]
MAESIRFLVRRGRWAAVVAVGFALAVAAACGGGEPAPPPAPAATPTPQPAATPVAPAVPAVQGTFKTGILEDLSTTNIWNMLGPEATAWNLYVLLEHYPTLYEYSDQRFDWVPSLADGFPSALRQETVDGETFWTAAVKLKQGFKWSDGKDVTAEDAAFTFNTAAQLRLPGNWASYVDPTVFNHAEALDPLMLKLFFKEKPGLSRFQFGVGFAPIVQKSFWEPTVSEAKAKLATVDAADAEALAATLEEAQQTLFAYTPQDEPSAGGFVLSKWEKGAFAENRVNQNYFFQGRTVTEHENGAYREEKPGVYSFAAYGEPTGPTALEVEEGPFVESTLFSLYSSQDAAVLALRRGEIDYIFNPSGLAAGLQQQVAGQPDITTASNPSNGFRYLGFNTRRPPMDSKEFRQAVALLIDKEFLTQRVLLGVALPIYSTVPEGNLYWHNPDVSQLGKGLSREERINQAVELLKGAGFTWEAEPQWNPDNRAVERGKGLRMPNGELVSQMEILAPSAGYDPLRATVAIWIEKWLNEAGIPVRVNLTGFNVIVPKVVMQQDFDMWILGWELTVFPGYLADFFHSGRAQPGDFNPGGYANSQFDALANQLVAETDVNRARDLAFQLQEILADEVPYVLLFTTPILEAYRSETVDFPYSDVLQGIQGGLGAAHGLVTVVRMS